MKLIIRVRRIQEAWDEILQAHIDNIISNMPRRVESIIDCCVFFFSSSRVFILDIFR
jgi:hypothetical protein